MDAGSRRRAQEKKVVRDSVRGAQTVEAMVRQWEDEEAAVQMLMEKQHAMLSELATGAHDFACLGPILARHNPPTPAAPGLSPAQTPGATTPTKGGGDGAPSGCGIILTPAMSIMASSPSVRASPAMRRTMEHLMARQHSIWEEVAETLGSRVAGMHTNPPIKIDGAPDPINVELPKLPSIRENVSIARDVYTNSVGKRRKGRGSPKSHRTGAGHGKRPAVAGSPMRVLPDLEAHSPAPAPGQGRKTAPAPIADTSAKTKTTAKEKTKAKVNAKQKAKNKRAELVKRVRDGHRSISPRPEWQNVESFRLLSGQDEKPKLTLPSVPGAAAPAEVRSTFSFA